MGITATVLLAAVLVATGCSAAKLAADSAPVPKAVQLATVVIASPPGGAKYSGILTPNSQVDLAFRVSGYVVEQLDDNGAVGLRADVGECFIKPLAATAVFVRSNPARR
jgi:multidrug efflux pump subunit AcrA (membrane-fusion protein)